MNNPTTNHPASPAPVKADRIAELRAESRDLIALLQRLGDGEYDDDDLSVAHDALAEIINLRLQRAALLECAEALAEIVGCPQGVDEATVPAGGVDVCPEQVVVSISVGLVRLRRAQAALAALNGDDHD